jgi:RNA polymerase sigma-70 factor (ECF subfamily)
LDTESQAWLKGLRATGPERERTIARLHELLLRAARFEVRRRAGGRLAAEREDLAQQSADDALVAILAKLDQYRGASRFTTWAYKFALLEAGVKTRRRVWQGRQVPLDSEGWQRLVDPSPRPDQEVQASQLLGALREAIADELTPHQREILLAVTLDDVPIDVLAERLATTRGALYKTVHDARRKLRARLIAEGLGDHIPGQGGDRGATA